MTDHVLRVKASGHSGRIVLQCSCGGLHHTIRDRFEPTLEHLTTIAREAGHA